MTPEEFRLAQNELMRPPVGAALVLLRDLAVAPVSPAAWTRITGALYPGVAAARSKSVLLARAYYASLNPAGTAPLLPETQYAPTMLLATLQRFAGAGLEDEAKASDAAVFGAAAVGRHVDQAGREYVARASSADNIRFARYDPYGETCAFCRLLVSRGPVYLSQVSGAFQSHPMCTCVAVPVFDPNGDWPGKQQYLDAEQLYVQSTADVSGDEKLRAFRAAVETAA